MDIYTIGHGKTILHTTYQEHYFLYVQLELANLKQNMLLQLIHANYIEPVVHLGRELGDHDHRIQQGSQKAIIHIHPFLK